MVFEIMASDFEFTQGTIHIVNLYLPDYYNTSYDLLKILNKQEIKRAERYKFVAHKERFIITRCFLRKILSNYLMCKAKDIIFSVTEKGKPYIENYDIEFNVSHSGEYSVIAISKAKPIGVDIEKIKPSFNESVAKRFFNEDEYQYLMKQSSVKQAECFYEIWAKKESFIKLFGKSIFDNPQEFSVLSTKIKNIVIKDILIHPDYKSAISTENPLNAIEYWGFQDAIYSKLHSSELKNA